MGIPTYFSHIIKRYPNVLSKLKKKGQRQESSRSKTIDNALLVRRKENNKEVHRNVDKLYLDSNSIIYDSISELTYDDDTSFENKLIQKVCSKLEEYISMVSPTKLVYIAFDGIAPHAKLKQQKNRRYKAWYMKQYNDKINNQDDSEYVPNVSSWDTSSITPGTEFMNKLNLQLRYYFRNSKKFSTHSVIISGSDEAGEGEHKIMSHIRNSSVVGDQTHSQSEVVFVYGLDADLIMLTLNHLTYCPSLYLFRETPEFIKSVDKSLDPCENYVIDVPYLKDSINKCILGEDILEDKSDISNYCCIEDYMFICFLLGNDFLPHFPSLNLRTVGMDYVIETYRNVILSSSYRIIEKDVDNRKVINWKHFRLLVRELAKNEKSNIMTEHRHRDKMERRIRELRDTKNVRSGDSFDEFMMDSPILERPAEKYINPFDHGWETRYYDMLCDIDLKKDTKEYDNKHKHRNEHPEIKRLCMNYLEGLEWTYNYYTGQRMDWEWSYKYNYAPLLHDLQYIIPYASDKKIIKDEDAVKYPTLSEAEQLAYTLPYSSRYLLPLPVRRKIEKSREESLKYYEIEWAYCRYFWEGHVLFK